MWKLTEHTMWEELENQFDWVRDMREVPQHPLHHAEGNVSIHTRMVLQKLEEDPGYDSLTEQEQAILWAAALLHDVEKRSTSVDEGGGRITSHGHARKGEYTARTILYRDVPAPFHIRELVASLVRYHGLPLWAMERANPQKKLLEASLRADTRLLKLLSRADLLGRICQDKERLMDSLELFELFCKEQGCWGIAREFASSSARFHYFNSPESYADYVPFEDFKSEVTVLSGLPGMGKDHYLQTMDKDIPVVSPDAIRRKYKIDPTDRSGNGWVIQTAKEEARIHLRKGENFIWNATNITRQMRSQLIDLLITYKAKVKIVYIERPYSVWRKQNREREYPVPEAVLDKMLGKLEVPQLMEAHEVEYYV